MKTVAERIEFGISGTVDGGHVLIVATDVERLRNLVAAATAGDALAAHMMAGALSVHIEAAGSAS